MDIAPTNTNAANAKSPEIESTDHPTGTTRIQSAKPLTFTNGVLKRHQSHHQLRHHHHHHHHHPIVVSYKECLKNHAASMGGHALDGCGEFMPSPTASATDPTSLKCAACGCHRNFHRREPEDIINAASLSNPTNTNTTATIEYQPYHRHQPPPPPTVQRPQPQPSSQRSPNSSSPPPISSSYYPSAPHMLLALSGNLQSAQETMISNLNVNATSNSSSRKRFRTKFSQSQKDKMFQFAERVGWKMQKRDDEMIQEFCNEVGVDRTVLKVWMHNNKNTFGKRDLNGNGGGGGGGRRINLDNYSNEENNGNNSNDDNGINKNGSDDHEDNINHNNSPMQNLNPHFESESVAHVATANGSSSSS